MTLKNAITAVFSGANCIKTNLSGWQQSEIKMDGLFSSGLSSVGIWLRTEGTIGTNETRTTDRRSGRTRIPG